MRCETLRILAGTTSLNVSPQVSRCSVIQSTNSLCVESGRISMAAGSMTRICAMARVLSILLALVAAVAIWSTARVFSATVDEPAHIAAGMQWLTTNRYDYDLNHPPLGRVAAALGPFLDGARGAGTSDLFEEGVRILGTGDGFVRTLALARHGELVFFLVLVFATWGLARRVLGEAGAALA